MALWAAINLRILIVMALLVGVHSLNRTISTFVPKYGPEAGGTEIYIVADSEANFTGLTNVTMLIENTTLFLTIEDKTSDVLVHCVSSAVTSGMVGLSGHITLHFDDGDTVLSTDAFMYRPNPVITDVTPLKTIIRGGIEQTIRGQNLDSVFYKEVTMTLVVRFQDGSITHHEQGHYSNDVQELIHLCTTPNSTTMFCPALPFNEYPFLRTSHNSETGINDEDYQIYFGFRLDGVTTYSNFSIIYVFFDPEFDNFPGDNHVEPFKTYKGQEFLNIDGNHLNFAADEHDYTVTVGNGSDCEILEVITNQITCRPPQQRPPVDSVNYDGEPKVHVRVGFKESFIGYLKYETTAWEDPQVRTAVIATVCVVALLVIIVPIIAVIVKRRMTSGGTSGHTGDGYTRPPGLMDRVPLDLKVLLEPCMKDAQRLKIGKMLGEGNFGSVHAGKFLDDNGQTVLVAAKTLKESGVTLAQFREFLEEATLMRDFKDMHVLHLVGVVFKEGRPYVLLPYMENGDLRSFLLNANNSFTVEDLLHYGQQAALGMAYLESLKCVHRDLAARNCMVSKDSIVKIADFGLARDIFQDDYYRVGDMTRPLPVKWMAPECLDDHKFTSKSDVWSFGVLLWELLTRGKKPYAHVDNYALKSFVLTGRRLDKPEVAPDEVYALMLKCWDLRPPLRPAFQEIADELAELLQAEDEELPAHIHEPRARNTAVEISTNYENLSRYVDHPHRYERVSRVPEEGATAAEPSAALGIDYKEARQYFDEIVDPHAEDGYMPPSEVEMGQNNNGYTPDLPGYLRMDSNQNGYLSPLATGGMDPTVHDQPPHSVSYQNMSAMAANPDSRHGSVDHTTVSIRT